MFDSLVNFQKEWKNESEATLKVLQTLNDMSLEQKVYSEGRTLGEIAWHIVETLHEMPTHAGLVIDGSLIEKYDRNKSENIAAAYQQASDAMVNEVMQKWNDAILPEPIEMYGMTWTHSEALYGMLKHEIHHRAQLTVLMRQAGLKVPGVYGPSLEEWEQYGMPPQK